MMLVREKNTRPTTAIARSLMESNCFTGMLTMNVAAGAAPVNLELWD
jgi:hypothetical protein